MHRVVECVGAHHLRLKKLHPNRSNKAQQFFFDEVSKTIKSNNWKSRSMTIASNGKSATLYMTTTSSRWF